MLVTIESTIGGNVAGYLQCTVTGNETISSLLSTYCESKVNLFVLYQILLFDLLHFIQIGNPSQSQLFTSGPERSCP